MLKAILFSSLAMVGLSAFAAPNGGEATTQTLVRELAKDVRPEAMLNWRVGANADYNVEGGMLSGTLHSFVREEVAIGFWVQQDVKLNFGSQKIEILYNKENGRVEEVLVDGQKQDPGNPDDMEVVESRREKVTVPKGEFDSIYAKIKNKKDNKISEVWMNPTVVPMGGMIKVLAPNPMGGTLTLELTDFEM